MRIKVRRKGGGPEDKKPKPPGEDVVEDRAKGTERKEETDSGPEAGEDSARKDRVTSLSAKIDRLETMVMAVQALREPTEARLSMLTEKIGELRSMLLTQSKDSTEARVKAEQALAALEGINPSEFRAAIMKRDREIETVKTKLEVLEDMIKATKNEIKEFRETLLKFKGFESVVDMAGEIRKSEARVQQLRDQVEVLTDKVMSAFMEFQRKLKEMTDLSVRLSVVEDNLKNTSKMAMRLDTKLKETITRSDFEKFVEEQLKGIRQSVPTDEDIKKMKESYERISEIESRLNGKLLKLESDMKVMQEGISKLLSLLLKPT